MKKSRSEKWQLNILSKVWAPLVLLGLLSLGACRPGGGVGESGRERLRLSGSLEAHEIRVGSKTGGRVAEVLAREGDWVEAGAPLVRFETNELQSLLEQAEARVEQHQIRWERLTRGSREEELAIARASTEVAKAGYEAVRTWPRAEEVTQAEAALSAAEAEMGSARATLTRLERLHQSGDISQQEFDAARFRLDQAVARRRLEEGRLTLLRNGARPEELRGAAERYQQAREAERLVRQGPRFEEIQEARAQLTEAQARANQIRVQLAEGQVSAPTRALVEVLSVRPGDLLQPGQTVARLLEPDQTWVRVYLPEPRLGLIRVGDPVEILVDGFQERRFPGQIEQINSQGEFTPRNIQSRDERNHQVFGVKVRLLQPDGTLKAGMAADVELSLRPPPKEAR
jgi:HlyD family secretion protein